MWLCAKEQGLCSHRFRCCFGTPGYTSVQQVTPTRCLRVQNSCARFFFRGPFAHRRGYRCRSKIWSLRKREEKILLEVSEMLSLFGRMKASHCSPLAVLARYSHCVVSRAEYCCFLGASLVALRVVTVERVVGLKPWQLRHPALLQQRRSVFLMEQLLPLSAGN